ncbi:MAG: hypothetical protein R3B70_03540 [Polyangiaceae bacterium]
MSRRNRAESPTLSLDSFLDIVTNVVGVLILIAVVTVLGAGEISVSAGPSSLSAPRPTAERVLFECIGEEVYFVDEKENVRLVQEAARAALKGNRLTPGALEQFLRDTDVGDATHRVQVSFATDDSTPVWSFRLRPGARGDTLDSLESPTSAFRRKLAELPPGTFVYFVVHDDSFAVFQKARDLARERGAGMGWHPVAGKEPLRLSAIGSLGRRIQ